MDMFKQHYSIFKVLSLLTNCQAQKRGFVTRVGALRVLLPGLPTTQKYVVSNAFQTWKGITEKDQKM